MNGSDIYDLVTQLLDGEEISTTLFETLVNLAKLKRESKRDWEVLKTRSTAYTISPSTLPATTFALPSNCLRPMKNTAKTHAVVFADPSTGKKVGYADQILFERQFDYLSTPGKFWIDHSDDTLHFTGTPPVPSTYYAYLFYIKASPAITYVPTGGQGWDAFNQTGVDFSPLLAYDVAISQKGGIDYDDINARMVSFMGIDVTDLEFSMNAWDDRMKLSALQV